MHHVYDRFIESWGVFPSNDDVSFNFETHIYIDFLLHMHLKYTKIPSLFYHIVRGYSYDDPTAHRDPTSILP
jgi:hypothetical protein